MSESKSFLESRKKKSLSFKTQRRMYVDDFADFDCLKSPFLKAQQRMYVRTSCTSTTLRTLTVLTLRFRKCSSACTYVRHVRRRLCGLWLSAGRGGGGERVGPCSERDDVHYHDPRQHAVVRRLIRHRPATADSTSACTYRKRKLAKKRIPFLAAPHSILIIFI